ncbi:MAG: mechanosensitive ion channel protein MscS [Chloroflexi bacterium]|nr:mechanosensitive ion channel protein MscS [Chloroflexota bacterium]
MDEVLTKLSEYYNAIIRSIPSILTAVLILIIGWVIARLVQKAVVRGMQRSKIDQQATLLVSQIAFYFILSIALVTALAELGVNVTALIASLGIAGFTIGFALQDVSKNFIAGILLLIQKPFRVGDTIEVSGYTGKVLSIDIRATEMQTLDGRIVIIPSGEVFVNPIVNFSRATQRKLEFQVGVPYDKDQEQVRRVALNTLLTLSGVLQDPAPQANFQAFGSYAVQLNLSFWVDPKQTDMTATKDEAVKAVQQAFLQAGIEIPYQSQTLVSSVNQSMEEST